MKETPEGGKGISQMKGALQAEGPGGAKAVRQVHGCHV